MKFTRYPKYILLLIIAIILCFIVFRKVNYLVEGNSAPATAPDTQSSANSKQEKLQDIVVSYTNDMYDKISSLIRKKTKESTNTTESIIDELKKNTDVIEQSTGVEQVEIDKWNELVKSIENRVIELRSNMVFQKNTGTSFKIRDDKIIGVINKYQ
jgi:hypothetical protein